MLNVLLVEDNLDLAATVIDYLDLEGINCDHATHGVAGLELLKQQCFDVLLLDLNLPRLGGLEVCTRLREEGSDLPILMLTARDRLEDKLAGFQVGTDDYLVKPFDLEEMVARVRVLASRRSGQARRLACGDLEMNLTEHQVMRAGQPVHLSPIAWKLLEVLLRTSPDVVSRAHLEARVWGDNVPDSNSLKVHLHRLRQAVDAPFDSPLIHTLPGHGIVLRP